MIKNNVIDLNARRKGANKVTKKLGSSVKKEQVQADPANAELNENSAILDMTERREAIINDERRKVRRTLLTGFIGAFVVVPQTSSSKGGLLKVDIYDISDSGIAFDMPTKSGQFRQQEEVAMRVYLSHDTYFPFTVLIKNARKLEGDPTYRHGADFVKGTVNDEALFHFVKFIETVSASLERDRGDILVSNLKK